MKCGECKQEMRHIEENIYVCHNPDCAYYMEEQLEGDRPGRF